MGFGREIGSDALTTRLAARRDLRFCLRVMDISPIKSAEKPSQPLMGLFWMVVTGICFVGVTAFVKLVGNNLPPVQSAFLRYLFGLIFLVPMIGHLRRAHLGQRVIGVFALRGVFHAAGVALWFLAMTQIPMAEVTAMNYLNPIYVTILASLFLGDKISTRRITAIFVALLGAFLILRPGFREINVGHIAMIFTALFFAVGYFLAKMLTDETSPGVVVAMLSIVVAICLCPFAVAVWQPVGLTDAIWLFVVACLATLAHYTMSLAFQAAPLSVTQPATFLQLIWASLVGLIFFEEAIDLFVMLGGTLIIASVCYIALREAWLRREAAKKSAN